MSPNSVQDQADPPLRYFGSQTDGGIASVRELLEYRDLFLMFAIRDLRLQYRQTVIGVAWAVLRPVILMCVFTALFRLLGRIPASDEGAYAVSLYAGLLPWQLFATTLTRSTSSLVANESIITKVYFPRLILVMIPLAVGFVDFLIASVVLLGLMFWYGMTPSITLLAAPFFVGLVVLASFALGTWLSAANALYRDIQYLVPFGVQVGMYVSPIVYEMRVVIPEEWQFLYCLNPMAGAVEGFRWALLGTPCPSIAMVLPSFLISSLMLVGGLLYFRRTERLVADRV